MSVYNKQHNVVFIHVPKTAGTSMERAPFTGGGGHKTAQTIKMEVGDDAWSRAFKFAFVRDPLERFASCYFHLMPEHKGVTFPEFVRRSAKWDESCLRKFTNHFSEQSFFLCDDDDQVMVDFVGEFHNLKRDWATVCERVGLKFNLPRKRVGKHSSYAEYWTPELMETVRMVYRRDYDLLGHHFLNEQERTER